VHGSLLNFVFVFWRPANQPSGALGEDSPDQLDFRVGRRAQFEGWISLLDACEGARVLVQEVSMWLYSTVLVHESCKLEFGRACLKRGGIERLSPVDLIKS